MPTPLESPAPRSPGRPNPFRERLEREIDCASLAKHLKDGPVEEVVLDLRAADKYAEGHIPGAVNARVQDIVQVAERYPAGTKFVTSCYHIGCTLSTRGAMALHDAGFPVRELLGGFKMWQELGHPVEPPRSMPPGGDEAERERRVETPPPA